MKHLAMLLAALTVSAMCVRAQEQPARVGASLGPPGSSPSPGRAVNSSEQLAAAIAEAKPGDRIIVSPGKYALSATVAVAPLTIEAAEAKNRPVLSPAEAGEDKFVLDLADMEGAVTLRGLVFDGQKKKVGALRTRNTRLVAEDCEFRDFAGITAVVTSVYGRDVGAHKGVRLGRCVFRRNPNSEKDSDACGAALYSFDVDNQLHVWAATQFEVAP